MFCGSGSSDPLLLPEPYHSKRSCHYCARVAISPLERRKEVNSELIDLDSSSAGGPAKKSDSFCKNRRPRALGAITGFTIISSRLAFPFSILPTVFYSGTLRCSACALLADWPCRTSIISVIDFFLFILSLNVRLSSLTGNRYARLPA